MLLSSASGPRLHGRLSSNVSRHQEMSVQLFGAYGLVVRKSERTSAWLARERESLIWYERWLLQRMPDGPRLPPFEDDHIMAARGGASARDVNIAVEQLEQLGCVEGRDFVVSESAFIDPMPPWLRQVEDGFAFVPETERGGQA